MIEDSSFTYDLQRPIEVHGESDEVSTLVFKECGTGYDSFYLKLRKYVMAAQMNSVDLLKRFQGLQGEDLQPTGGAEIKPLHAVKKDEFEATVEDSAKFLEVILGVGDEMEKLVGVFGKMVSQPGGKGICFTEGGARVKQGAWEQVCIEDKISAATRYCAFFGIGLDNLQRQDSDPVSESRSQAKVL